MRSKRLEMVHERHAGRLVSSWRVVEDSPVMFTPLVDFAELVRFTRVTRLREVTDFDESPFAAPAIPPRDPLPGRGPRAR